MTIPGTRQIYFSMVAEIAPNGADLQELAQDLDRRLENFLGDAPITGSSPAELESLDVRPCVVLTHQEAQLDEKQASDFLSALLESGNLKLEAIPGLLARYALTDVAEMRSELAERMALHEDEDPDGDATAAGGADTAAGRRQAKVDRLLAPVRAGFDGRGEPYARGFRDAVESLVLALSAQPVAERAIRAAVDEAIDAYVNNHELDDDQSQDSPKSDAPRAA